jgi:hypothetical protein
MIEMSDLKFRFIRVYWLSHTASVMYVLPFLKTDIAKLMTTMACHMIATLVLFYEHPTARTTLPLLKSIFEIFVTRTIMIRKLAFLTESSLALWTLELRMGKVYNPFTILRRT